MIYINKNNNFLEKLEYFSKNLYKFYYEDLLPNTFKEQINA